MSATVFDLSHREVDVLENLQEAGEMGREVGRTNRFLISMASKGLVSAEAAKRGSRSARWFITRDGAMALRASGKRRS
jgi:hypothetical protein